MKSGPLNGVRVLELANIGPLQHAGMLLSDLGAEVLRLDRKAHVDAGSGLQGPYSARSIIDRGRRSAGIDLKHPDAAGLVLDLAARADVMLEGFRPGVAERLGVGPDVARARNPRLIYGRMTGWGQQGPMAHEVGHDINYIALTGALDMIGEEGGPPVPPLNLIGDFGGGSMLLVVGVLAALVERASSGAGQVIDAAMIDGTALLLAPFVSAATSPGWGARGTNVLDGGAPFYGAYVCADGEYVSVAAMEPQFYAAFCERLGLEDVPTDIASQHDHAQWPALKRRVADRFRTRTRAEWIEHMAGHEVCFAPVLTVADAAQHPHHVTRATFVELDGALHPNAAPRFSRTPAAVQHTARPAGSDTDTALADWGVDPERVAALRKCGAVA